MERNRVVAILVTVVLLIGALFLISRAFSWITNSSNNQEFTQTERVSLATSADTELVTSITTSGKIVNEEDFNSIRISVNKNKRTLEILKGYSYVVTKHVQFKNNQSAFETFLLAIEREGFTQSKKGESSDERGFCPFGTRTVYEATGNTDSNLRLWSASCSKKVGTFDGDSGNIKKLFQAQIPDYRDLVSGVDL